VSDPPRIIIALPRNWIPKGDGEPATSPVVLNTIISRHRVGDVVRAEAFQKGVVPSAISLILEGLPRYKVKTFESAGLPITDPMRVFRTRWLSSRNRGMGALSGRWDSAHVRFAGERHDKKPTVAETKSASPMTMARATLGVQREDQVGTPTH
jgi:hypothetical protein